MIEKLTLSFVILKIWTYKIIAWTFQQSLKITKWKAQESRSDMYNTSFLWYKPLWNFAAIHVQSVLYHQKFSCKCDFMFFVISSWYCWCLVQHWLIFTLQIFYSAARVSPYFLVRHFGSLLSVAVSRFSSAFQLLFLNIFSTNIIIFW